MNLAAYAGRWVALVTLPGGVRQVAGVGETADEARRLAQHNRPRERVTVQFVEWEGGERLQLPPLLAELRPFFLQQATAVYLVGGAVRDAVLGRPSHDLDFVVAQGGIKLALRLGDMLGAPAYILDRARDTGRVVLADTTLDFACFRGEDLAADLLARDFTINALALPATAVYVHSLIDPSGGLADLAAGRLRPTHVEAIVSDPVRALRGVRLALAFGLAVDETTTAVLRAAAPLLPNVSPERVRDELVKLLQTAVPDQAIGWLHDLGLLAVVLPEITALDNVAQSLPHHEPVLAHTISVLRWLMAVERAVVGQEPALAAVTEVLAPCAEALQQHWARGVDGGINGRLLLRLGALFHDVGKKETQTMEENGRIRFLGHDMAGAETAAAWLRQFAFSNEAIDHVRLLVAGHMRPLNLAQSGSLSRRSVYRYFRQTRLAGLDIAVLSLADHLATYNGPGEAETWEQLLKITGQLCHHYIHGHAETVAPPPLLNGRQLMAALQLPPGPEIGRLLRLIEEGQAAGEIASVEEALAFAWQVRQ
ncbi:MAG: HDIG domain-containing protein [Anaerolineales bacterium]|nr:HDIG domain-containing protein [Anaerolineales bacterium]